VSAALTLERPIAPACGDFESTVSLARQLGRATIVSRVEALPRLPDPLAFLHAAARVLGHGVLWEQRTAGVTFAGAGAAWIVRANGASRFGTVAAAIGDVGAHLVRDDTLTNFPLIGGFAFGVNADPSPNWRDFPDALFVIPQILVQIDGDDAFLRITARVTPDATPHDVEIEFCALLEQARFWLDAPLPVPPRTSVIGRHSHPDRRAWESSVATATSLIRQDQLNKVVLAREDRLLFDHAISPVATLASLRDLDPAATRFALQSGGSWFIGSTPERLVRLQDGRVDVTCLAGSVGIGSDDDATRRLAAQLLASAKDRDEHDIVVRSTVRALEELCEEVTPAPDSPRVVRARSVQHLETPISAHMSRAGRILDLIERLHPTPAVGGFPREQALTAIRELEAIDRGWYAGPFGWTGLDGQGEFAVAIRSALLAGRSASLYAGCGIMANSDPAAEWEETCLKLRPMLAALGVA
jgi:isochorismate synthase